MSGDVQPRKRKDKKRKRDEDESSHGVHITKMGGDDVHLHVHEEHGTGGHWCAKLFFFGLLAILLGLIGLILLENRGLADLDTPLSESRFSNYFVGWVDEHREGEHEHDAIQASIEEHDEHDEPFEETEDHDEHDEPYEETEDHEEEEDADDEGSQDNDDEEEELEENETDAKELINKTEEEDDDDDDEDGLENEEDEDNEEATKELKNETEEDENEDDNNENDDDVDENYNDDDDENELENTNTVEGTQEDEEDDDEKIVTKENNETEEDENDDAHEDDWENTTKEDTNIDENNANDDGPTNSRSAQHTSANSKTNRASNADDDDNNDDNNDDKDDDDPFDEEDDNDFESLETVVDNDAEEILLLQEKERQQRQNAAKNEPAEVENENDDAETAQSWVTSQIKPKETKETPSGGPQTADDIAFEQELHRANEEMLRENLTAAFHAYQLLSQKYPQEPRVFLGQAKALDRLSQQSHSNRLLTDALAAYKRYLAFDNEITNDVEFRETAEQCINRMRFLGFTVQALPIHEQLISRFDNDPSLRNQMTITLLILNRC